MGEVTRVQFVSLSEIPANQPCCDAAGERNYRRGYHQGYKYALSALEAWLPEDLYAELRRFVQCDLHAWSVKGQLPEASRFSFPPKPSVPQPGRSAKRQKQAMSGTVYIVLAEGTTRIKIGWSTSPQQRIETLRTACPFPLRVLREIPSLRAGALERELHQRYAPYRQQGEWFELPAECLGALLIEDFTHAR